jgi:hypothetical protein
MKRSRLGAVLLSAGLRGRQAEPWFGARVAPACAAKRGRSRSSTRRPRRGASWCAWMSWSGAPQQPRAVQEHSASPCPRARARAPSKRSTTVAAAQALSLARSTRRAAQRSGHRDRHAPHQRELRHLLGADRRVGRCGCAAHLGSPRPSECPPRHRRGALCPGPSALGGCLPAHVGGLPHPDRTVVEERALLGAQRAAIRDRGGDLRRGAGGDGATASGNAPRHPFHWGRRRRHRPRRQPGIALVPSVA